MTKTDLIFLLLISNCVLFTGAVGFAVAWIRARDRALRVRIEALSAAEPSHNTANLERALDAIALEVERISEGQRFTTRLLAERDRGPAIEPRAQFPQPVITPH